MKLKNINVGDTLEVKRSIVDEPLNDKLSPDMLCKVTYVEPLHYEGELTVRVTSDDDDIEWVSHRHLRKPRTKVSVGDEFIVTKSSVPDDRLNVGCKRVVVFVRDGDSVLDNSYVMTAHKNGTFELCGIDVFLEKADKPKQLTGSELTRKMLADGETSILCYVSDTSDDQAVKGRIAKDITDYRGGWFRTNGIFPWGYAVPVEAVPVEEVTPLSRWTHGNGSTYTVIIVTNEHSENQDRYPTTVVYRDYDYKTWSKPLSDWHRSMTKMED